MLCATPLESFLNIGIVTTWFERGASYVSRAFYDTLSIANNVFIYARGGEEYAIGDPNWDKEYVTWGKKILKKPLGYIDWDDFYWWIKTNNIDLLIFNEQHDWDIILKCQKLDIPIGSYVDYYTKGTVRFFCLYDFLICNTKRHYSVFKKHSQVIFLPWGTDTGVFLPHVAKDEDKIVFFHSAGMGKGNLRKGTDLLVKAFKDVIGDTRLIIHAQFGIDQFEDLKKFIEQDERITFIEKTVSHPGLYYMGDVYVYPTRLDGIGLTIAEALSSGLPVIATDNPPMNEFIIDGFTGRLVKVDHYEVRKDKYYWPQAICDVFDLTQAMQYYVDNPLVVKEQKINARKYAEEFLDWRKNSESLNLILPHIKTLRKKICIERLISISILTALPKLFLLKKFVLKTRSFIFRFFSK